MSYIYTINKEKFDLEKFKEIGFELLPEDICGPNESIYYMISEQPKDGECVRQLLQLYQGWSEKICNDKYARKAHANMGIKYRLKKGKHILIVTDELREMFSLWRVEVDLEDGNLYFTISDGNLPRFYDADKVLDKYCKDIIDLLAVNELIEKVEIVPKKC